MPTNISVNAIWIFSVLGAIVLGLSIYLGILYGKLKKQSVALKVAQEKARKVREERQEDIRSSLRTLALVIMQEQCGPTEGCIRVKKLVDEIEYLKDREELVVFHEMYEEVKDLAILQEYKDLSAQEKFKQDNIRYALEEKYNSRLKKASESLKNLIDNPPNQ